MQGAVVFRARAGLWYLPAAVVTRVVSVPSLGPVPGAPPELAGLAHVDGRVIAVLDVGPSRAAMLVASFVGEPVGIVGAEIVATGTFPRVHDHVAYESEHARPFDLAGVVARVRHTHWDWAV